ncbi:NGFI-A-binding protein-like [Papilio machaon]|uniref:NGFI-A-binding protein-like n=1 Tax=Papilio machaon TaxID=76193 RepID=A0A194RDF7_PAPMA|nr:NGFI-A-binding protein-like [Papilio machaon]
MQRASLLAYYDTLLEMGGDDVQQLCDAGEEEFLEIMALVGMASKPLHVRRLQKALQEWVNNPSLFQIPIVPNICTENPFIQCNQRLLNIPPTIPNVLPRTVASPESSRPMYSPSPGAPDNSCGSTTSAPNVSPVHSQATFTKIILPSSPAAAPITTTARSFSPQSACPPASSGSSPSSVTSPVQLTPVLLDIHVQKLAAAAEKLSKHLPQLEPKPQNTKKKMCKDLELVMMMPETDPRRMEEIRKYAAIYGRFDCKRKPEKPLTLHEVMVNEAAAQLCRCVPALLTRRDELFPLARQLVRRAGLHNSKHGLPPTSTAEERDRDEEETPNKRPRQVAPVTHVDLTDYLPPTSTAEERDRDEEETPSKRPRQVAPVTHDGDDNGVRASPDAARGTSNHSWWGMKTESDDADSRCSYSSASTPPPVTLSLVCLPTKTIVV